MIYLDTPEGHRAAAKDRREKGMRRAAYSCGHTDHFETVVSWPPRKCQECKKGSLIEEAWMMEVKLKPHPWV